MPDEPMDEGDARPNVSVRPVWFAADRETLLDMDVPEGTAAWLDANDYRFTPGSLLAVPGADGSVAGAVFAPDPHAPLAAGSLARKLPPGPWKLHGETGPLAHLATMLGGYRFRRYRTQEENGGDQPRARIEAGPNGERDGRVAAGMALARDLINTPASDMGPVEIEAAARALAERHGAHVEVTAGEALERECPMVHAVGRASTRAPRLIDMRWGEGGPRVTLVGKGVAFDTGGLDIKPASNMLLMKKDMGGAAAVLGLASMVMAGAMPVRLRVLVPAVENAIAGNAFRPSDVLASRLGLTVEIGNTDAEGRLILADALALADEEEPDLLIDMATLTGAARVALGPDVPPFFTHHDAVAGAIAAAGSAEADPVWRLPLHHAYRKMLKSEVADTNNIGGAGMAGAITAALFLDRFVSKARAHVHFDIYGWCPENKPHCPKGGEAQAIRALHRVLENVVRDGLPEGSGEPEGSSESEGSGD